MIPREGSATAKFMLELESLALRKFGILGNSMHVEALLIEEEDEELT